MSHINPLSGFLSKSGTHFLPNECIKNKLHGKLSRGLAEKQDTLTIGTIETRLFKIPRLIKNVIKTCQCCFFRELWKTV